MSCEHAGAGARGEHKGNGPRGAAGEAPRCNSQAVQCVCIWRAEAIQHNIAPEGLHTDPCVCVLTLSGGPSEGSEDGDSDRESEDGEVLGLLEEEEEEQDGDGCSDGEDDGDPDGCSDDGGAGCGRRGARHGARRRRDAAAVDGTPRMAGSYGDEFARLIGSLGLRSEGGVGRVAAAAAAGAGAAGAGGGAGEEGLPQLPEEVWMAMLQQLGVREVCMAGRTCRWVLEERGLREARGMLICTCRTKVGVERAFGGGGVALARFAACLCAGGIK